MSNTEINKKATDKKNSVKKSAIKNTCDSTICCGRKSHYSKCENKITNDEKKIIQIKII